MSSDKTWNKPPIFLIGVHERSGSNYLSDILRLHQTVDLREPLWEDYLTNQIHLLEQYAEQTAKFWYTRYGFIDYKWDSPEHARKYHEVVARLKQHLGDGLIQFLSTFPLEHGSYDPPDRLFTKTPIPSNLRSFYNFFPNAKLLLLVRDARDTCESAYRSWHESNPDKIPSREHWLTQWASHADQLLDFVEFDQSNEHNWRMIRYEDYVNDTTHVNDLLNFLELDPEQFDWKALDSLPVRGSSNRVGSHEQVQWTDTSAKSRLDSKPKWTDWDQHTRNMFERVAGEQFVRLGYTYGDDW